MMGTLRVMAKDVWDNLLEIGMVFMLVILLAIMLSVTATVVYVIASQFGVLTLSPVIAAIVAVGWAWIHSAHRRARNTNQGE